MTISTPSFTATDAYPYECSCGERFSTVDAAYHCRKCRTYCVFGHCTHVVDIRTDTVVRGFEPSEERYAVAAASYEKRMKVEQEEFELELQMWRKEGIRYEAEVKRQQLEAARRRSEEDEDRLWDEQERLMK